LYIQFLIEGDGNLKGIARNRIKEVNKQRKHDFAGWLAVCVLQSTETS